MYDDEVNTMVRANMIVVDDNNNTGNHEEEENVERFHKNSYSYIAEGTMRAVKKIKKNKLKYTEGEKR